MTTAADRRRRPFALAIALLVTVLGLAVGTHAAGAQAGRTQVDPCPITDPLCHSTTSTGPSLSTTTTRFEFPTSTTDDTSTTDFSSTSTTFRARTTTTQDQTTTTARSVTVSTLADLLVPGDGTKGAESTTTTAKALATAKGGLSDDQLIVLVVAGLGLLALVFGILTWRYWSATRPRVDDRAPRG